MEPFPELTRTQETSSEHPEWLFLAYQWEHFIETPKRLDLSMRLNNLYIVIKRKS